MGPPAPCVGARIQRSFSRWDGYEPRMTRVRRTVTVVVGMYWGAWVFVIAGQLLGVSRPVGLALLAVGVGLGAVAGWRDAVGLRPRSTEADHETFLGYVAFGGLVIGFAGLALPSPGNVGVPLAGLGVFAWTIARLFIAGWNDGGADQRPAPPVARR